MSKADLTGDTFRREVARTMAHQCALKFERLHAVAVRASHASRNRLRRMCGQVFDGARSQEDVALHRRIGAFDHIKRKAMVEALYNNPELASLVPFVRLFHGKDSKHVWCDDDGLSHEQGVSHKSMPLFVSAR